MAKVLTFQEISEGLYQIFSKPFADGRISIEKDYKVLTFDHYKPRIKVVPGVDLDSSGFPQEVKPVYLRHKTLLGAFFHVPLWKISPIYKVSFKSYMAQPFGQVVVAPVDPELYRNILKSKVAETAFLLKQKAGMLFVVAIMCLVMGVLLGYVLAPVINGSVASLASQVSPVAQNVTVGAG
jgi:hypothetical protein